MLCKFKRSFIKSNYILIVNEKLAMHKALKCQVQARTKEKGGIKKHK